MAKHSHRFIEAFDGFVGFGMDRASDEKALIYYLQKISDDALAETLMPRMSEEELRKLFDLLSGLLKTHLNEEEYHRLFLKDR